MENTCRACLRIQPKLFPLFQEETFVNKLQTISSIQFVDSPNFPSTICEECVNNVNSFYNFRKVIINTDKDLRERSATLERFKQRITDKTTSPDFAVNLPHDSKLTCDIMKLYKCSYCPKTFSSRYELHNHKRTGHIAKGICSICGMSVRTDNLHKHIKIHTEKPVECPHCGKTFKNSESLRSHLLMHKGTVFTCEICGKQSKVKSEHIRHVKTHTDPDNRKKVCKICGKKVRNFKVHMNSHTGERPHLCDFCNKGFTSLYSLKVHRRQHTNEKPYRCKICPEAFPQKVSLSAHMKSKHNFCNF